MRVVQQLISHLTRTGHLTRQQIDELRAMGLVSLQEAAEPPFQPRPDEPDEPEDPQLDVLDQLGDDLLDDVRRASTKGRGGRRAKPTITTRLATSVERAVAAQDQFEPALHAIAKRLDATVSAAAAAQTIAAATPEECERALRHGNLWAQSWPFVASAPIGSDWTEPEQRRFRHLFEPSGHMRTPLPAALKANDSMPRAGELIRAHHRLSTAFGEVWRGFDPAKAFSRLGMSNDPMAYETMVILHSANAERRRIRDLAALPAEVGLPTPNWLQPNAFDVDGPWPIAARISPVTVLPFLSSCTTLWETRSYGNGSRPTQWLEIGGSEYGGRWSDYYPHEWFALGLVDSRWVRIRATRHDIVPRGRISQRITFGHVEYVHRCTARNCMDTRGFTLADGSGQVVVTWHGRGHRLVQPPAHAKYDDMWAHDFVDQPLLTCPKEWEYQ